MSVGGQCKVANDAPNFCSGWLSMMVFSLMSPLEVQPHRLDKGFVKGKYFGTGTFECWWAMSSGQRCSKLFLYMAFNDGFLFESTFSYLSRLGSNI